MSARGAMAEATHRRRAGTSGIAGQLYEVKTAMLALLNALLAKRRGVVDRFWLGTNVDGLGVADDIVIKCSTRGRHKLIFVQCKHRDNPKHKVTLGDVMRDDGDFALTHLLNSYLSIIHKCSATDDVVLRDAHDNVEIVMYTPAETSFEERAREITLETDDFIVTNVKGKVFQFNSTGDHIDALLESMSRSHTRLLAKLLAKFALSGNGANLMMNYLTQMYHVYIRNHILQVSDTIDKNTRKVKFRPEFFGNEDFFISRLRKLFFNEILTCKKHFKITQVNLQELEMILKRVALELSCDATSDLRTKSEKQTLFINELREGLKVLDVSTPTIDKVLTDFATSKMCEMRAIRVPDAFGNIDLEVRKERRLDHLSKQIVKILQDSDITSVDGKVSVQSRHVGPNAMLTKGDIQVNGGIGGLVGNLLIMDDETGMLKFNCDRNSLPYNARKLLIKLENLILGTDSRVDLSSYRLRFSIPGFPRLSWEDRAADESLLTDFLCKFKFYSCQTREDDLVNIIEKRMIEYYNTDFNIHKTYLEVHDKLQSWWREKDRGVYLTETCNYFTEADKPDLLCTFKFIHTNEVNNRGVVFSATALQSLDMEHFMAQKESRILNVTTNNLTLTTIKLLQYFKSNNNLCYNYSVIDMEYVVQNNLFDDMLQELQKTQIKNIIIKSTDSDVEHYTLCNELEDLEKNFFILTESKLTGAPTAACKYVQDHTNRFLDLSQESQTELLKEIAILFQGEETNLRKLIINEECARLIDANVLDTIITKSDIKIGKPLADVKYNSIKDLYIDRKVHRRVTIRAEYITNHSNLKEENMENVAVTYRKHMKESTVERRRDILLVSNNVQDFEELCANYGHCVHWFYKKNNDFIWTKSRGSLNKIRNYVERNGRKGDSCSINTMADLEDKTVIIAAGPGMGKTSLLTHLSIATKRKYPSSWIVRVNLLDHSDKFCEWKDNNVDIDETESFNFLIDVMRSYKVVSPTESNALGVFEERLFKQYYRSGDVVAIFDGYDEISPDYKDQAIELLVSLNRTAIRRLWVTTRPYDVQRELENKLGTFSYTLVPFSEYDQESFLQRYYKGQPKIAEEFLEYIDSGVRSILTTPLHLYIIITVFDKGNDKRVYVKSDLYTLYKHFIDITVRDIYIREKSRLLNENNPNVKRLIDKLCKETIGNHKLLAVSAVTHKDELSAIFNEQERRTLNELIEDIMSGEERAGIVDRVVDGTPRFVHMTFAEYFVVEYFCDKLKSGTVSDIIWKMLINNRNIRKFFDGRLANDRHLAELNSNYEVSEQLLDLLLKRNESLLIIAIEENLGHVINFCSHIIKTSLNAKSLPAFNIFVMKYSFFKQIFKNNHVSLVYNILKARVFENPQQEIDERMQLFISILYCAVRYIKGDGVLTDLRSIFDNIAEKCFNFEEVFLKRYYWIKKDITVNNKRSCTILKAALITNRFSFLTPHLAKLSEEQLMEVAAVTNAGWTQAQWAAGQKQVEFFDFYKKHLSKNNFRNICLTKSGHRQTPVALLFAVINMIDKTYFDEYLSLYEYVYPSDDEDAETLSVDSLRNLYTTAARCKLMFSENTTIFIQNTKILEKVKRFYASNNENDFEFGTTLLYHATECNNDVFIYALLQDVDVSVITRIMMTKCDNGRTILHNAMHHGTSVNLLRLQLLNCEQLAMITTATDCLGRTPAHVAAQQRDLSLFRLLRDSSHNVSLEHLEQIAIVADHDGCTPAHEAAKANNLMFFHYFRKHLNRNNFRKICLIKNRLDQMPIPLLLFAVESNNEESIKDYISLCEYICPSQDEDEAGFHEDQLRDMYLVAATCKSLFTESTDWFTNKMLDKIKYYFYASHDDDIYYGTRLLYHAITCNNEIIIETLFHQVNDAGRIARIMMTKCDNSKTILHNAIEHDVNTPLLKLELLTSEHLLEVAIVADDQGWTPAHAVVQQDLIISTSFQDHLERLSPEQLMQVVTVADRYGWTPAHEVAQGQNFIFFLYLKNCLDKNNFRAICLTENEFQQMPILLLFAGINVHDEETIINYSSLCEYICPADDEDEASFDRDRLRTMYTVAATCKSIFVVNTGWFVIKMLNDIKHYFNIQSDVEFGARLLYHASMCNNEIVVQVLLEEIEDAEKNLEVMMTKCDNGRTILHNAVRHSVNIKLLHLDWLSPEQLVEVATVVDYRGWTAAHAAAQRELTFFDSLKDNLKRLSPAQLMQVATVSNRNGWTPAHEAAQQLDATAFNCLNSCLDKLSPEHLVQIASITDCNGESPLRIVARHKYLDCFYYFQERLDKIDFRRICLTRNGTANETPLETLCASAILHTRDNESDEFVIKCLSLCEYMCPSNEETEKDFNKDDLACLCSLVSKYEVLFKRLGNSRFVENMLDEANRSRSHKNLTII